MDKLSLKNYPPNLVSILICLVAAINLGFTTFWSQFSEHKTLNVWQQVLCIATTYGTALTALTCINKYVMWRPYLKLLGICDIRGQYKGRLISSFHYEDNPSLPNIEINLEAKVAQNINGFVVDMSFFSINMPGVPLSSSTSYDGDIQKGPDGTYKITYFFSNKGNKLHPSEKEVGLTNHDGVCVLKFNPSTRMFDGEYFTHERASYGKIVMEPAQKIK